MTPIADVAKALSIAIDRLIVIMEFGGPPREVAWEALAQIHAAIPTRRDTGCAR
jgi:hypothetical protein